MIRRKFTDAREKELPHMRNNNEKEPNVASKVIKYISPS